MNRDELFINAGSLPGPLREEETKYLLLQVKKGDKDAEEKLVKHNIRFVLKIVVNNFENIRYDKKELVSIANIGLLNAIRTFDVNRNVKFATYSYKCITNELLMFIRKLKFEMNLIDFQGLFLEESDDDLIKFENIVGYTDKNFNNCINSELAYAIKDFFNILSERDKCIMVLYFGFGSDSSLSQGKIAEYLNINRSYVCRIISKHIKGLRSYLIKYGLIEKRKIVLKKRKGL